MIAFTLVRIAFAVVSILTTRCYYYGSRNIDRKERRPRKVDLRKINLTEFRPTRKFAHLKIAPRNIDLTENSPNRNLARMENRPIGKVT